MCHIKYRQRLLTKTGHVMLETDHLLRPSGGGGRGFGGGGQFSKRLDSGGSILKMYEM